eukprot:scaffold11636_cov62-Cyclotella_meneghiniana.AAC.2
MPPDNRPGNFVIKDIRQLGHIFSGIAAMKVWGIKHGRVGDYFEPLFSCYEDDAFPLVSGSGYRSGVATAINRSAIVPNRPAILRGGTFVLFLR